MKKKVQIEIGSYVVVTTSYRGVFGGKLVSRENDEVTLAEARVCFYWSQETRGFVGLAVTGPKLGSRVSPASSIMTIPNVTAIIVCTDTAQKQWEAELWS